MAISFVGSGTLTNTNTATAFAFSSLKDSSNATPTVAQGDLVVVTIARGCTSSGQGTITGYTTAFGTLPYGNDTTDVTLQVYYKVMGSTPDTSVTIPASGNITFCQAATIHVFRGVDTTTPLDVTPTTATGINGGNANPPSITPVIGGAWIINVGGTSGSASAAITVGTNPAGMDTTTNLFRALSNTSNSNMVGVAFAVNTSWSSGAFDGGAFSTANTNVAQAWAAGAIALRPKATTQTVTTSGSGTWTVPTGVTAVRVECWGAGGSGGRNSGGGGGAYSQATVSVTPGASISYSVAAPTDADSSSDTGVPSGDTWFVNTTTVLAKGGYNASTSTSGASTISGGQAASGVGTLKYSGGSGAKGGGGGSASQFGNGGSGGAGTTQATTVGGDCPGGGLGATTQATAGGSNVEGGGGGSSKWNSGGGGTGGSPGGGSGGNSGGSFSYLGSPGQIRLTYPVAPVATTPTRGNVSGWWY